MHWQKRYLWDKYIWRDRQCSQHQYQKAQEARSLPTPSSHTVAHLSNVSIINRRHTFNAEGPILAVDVDVAHSKLIPFTIIEALSSAAIIMANATILIRSFVWGLPTKGRITLTETIHVLLCLVNFEKFHNNTQKNNTQLQHQTTTISRWIWLTHSEWTIISPVLLATLFQRHHELCNWV